MNKHKRLPLFWAAFSLLLLFTVNPAFVQASEKPVDVDTLFNCTWSASTNYPVTILDQATASAGGFLYSFAGVSTAIIANSYKFDGTTWTPIAPLPVALEFPAAVSNGTDIYVVGGSDYGAGVSVTTLYRYNVGTNTYTTLAPCTTATWNHAAVYLGGKIYKFAGSANTVSTTATEIYDVAGNSWTAGPAYPIAVSFVGAWTDGTFVYGAGGIASVGSVASLKTYRLDPANLGAGWVDAAIADLPQTRWGAAAMFYSPDGLLAGGYVNGSAAANLSNTAVSYDLGTNTWNSIPNMSGAGAASERSRMTGGVLSGSVYVVGGRSAASSGFVGTNSNQKLQCLNVPTNILSAAGSMIISAGGNGVLDPGETVTVALGVQNSGGPGVVCTGALTTGTLQATGGVTAPSGPQIYGMLCSPPVATFKNFTFTVDPMVACGATVTASLQMQDGVTNYGTFTYPFVTGTSAVAFAQNWDAVVAPALPAGWTTSATGIGVPWVTSTVTPFSAPNEAFAPDPSNIGDSQLVSPTFAVPAGGATLTFKNSFNTEDGFDGMVLEISINGGAFADIITAGGTFVAGPYTGAISTAFASPIAGRQAWEGNSAGYITSTVTLPPAANGQMAALKWRMASDNSVAAVGVMIDDISIANPVCDSASPLVSAASRLTQGAAGDFDIPLPLLPMGVTTGAGIECRRGGGASQDTYTIVANFATPHTPASISALTVDCGSVAPPVQGANPNQLLFVVSGPCYNTSAVAQYSGIHFITDLVSVWVTWGHLYGDSNGNGVVNGGDSIQVRGRAGLPVDATTFRSDLTADGNINGGDTTVARSRSGNFLP